MRRTMSIPFGPEDLHLWYVLCDEVAIPVLLETYQRLMTAADRARCDKYLCARSRHEYLVTRRLVRTVLSRYADVDPRCWEFRVNRYGRPEIAAPLDLPLRFSLSNTDGLVVCAVALDRDVGVDVEALDRPGDSLAAAAGVFASAERAALRALTPPAQRHRFFVYWTLKEAYIKARGLGLSIPLDKFAFVLEPGAPIRIALDPGLDDEADTWRFVQFQPTQRHLLAAAVRQTSQAQALAGSQQGIRLIVRHTALSLSS